MTTTSRVLEWVELGTGTGTDNDTALTTPANKAASASAPALNETTGIFVIKSGGADSSALVDGAVMYALTFASTDAANETYGARIWGWRKIGTTYWPHLLGELSMTAGALTGVASTTVSNSWFFPDAIVIDDDNTRGASIEVHTSGTDGTAHVTFDATGFQWVEVEASCETVAAFVRVFYSAL